MKNPLAENPRVPVPGSSGQGQSAPKAKPKGVVDGKQVNIPVPPVLSSAGTEKARSAELLEYSVQAGRRFFQE